MLDEQQVRDRVEPERVEELAEDEVARLALGEEHAPEEERDAHVRARRF